MKFRRHCVTVSGARDVLRGTSMRKDGMQWHTRGRNLTFGIAACFQSGLIGFIRSAKFVSFYPSLHSANHYLAANQTTFDVSGRISASYLTCGCSWRGCRGLYAEPTAVVEVDARNSRFLGFYARSNALAKIDGCNQAVGLVGKWYERLGNLSSRDRFCRVIFKLPFRQETPRIIIISWNNLMVKSKQGQNTVGFGSIRYRLKCNMVVNCKCNSDDVAVVKEDARAESVRHAQNKRDQMSFDRSPDTIAIFIT